MRIKELDSLRGLAALAVVFYHYTTQYEKLFGHSSQLSWEINYGSLGVHLFFMISGFVIFMTLDHVNKPRDFAVSRFSRLYPAYWFAIILTTTIVYIFGLKGEERDIFTTLINITMLQGIFEIPDVDGVYWTLMYELLFYILMFSLLKLKHLHLVCWYIAIAVSLNIVNNLVSWIPWKVQLFLLLQYNHLFGAGIIFYLIRKNTNSLIYTSILALCLAAQWTHGNTINSLIVTCFFIIFSLFTFKKLEFLAIKPLIWLGSISYSLYLLHQNIGYIVIRELEETGLSINLSILCALLISLGLAHFAVKIIEKPGQLWIKRKLQ